jgi:hypothetical protein
MRSRRAGVALALAIGAFELWPRAVAACSCLPPPSPLEAAQAATAVFEGKVSGRTDEAAEGEYGLSYAHYEFEVVRQWRGTPAERLVVRTASSSAACGRELTIGETYLVYAREIEDRLSDNACSRTRPIADAAEDLAALEGDVADDGVQREPPRIEPIAAQAPPAPAPSARGCDGAAGAGAWGALMWLASLRRRRR